MSKIKPWLRLYTEVVRDWKVQQLPLDLFKLWINLLCLAKINDGRLPKNEVIAWELRTSEEEVVRGLEVLHGVGLLDQTADGFAPHNWDERQFKSDGRSYWNRMQDRKRKANGSKAVDHRPADRPSDRPSDRPLDRLDQSLRKNRRLEAKAVSQTDSQGEARKGLSKGSEVRKVEDSPSAGPTVAGAAPSHTTQSEPLKAERGSAPAPRVRLDLPTASMSLDDWLRHYSAFRRVGSVAWPAELGPTPRELGCAMPAVVREMWSRQHGPPSNGADPPLAAVPEISIESTDDQTFLRVT